MYASHGSMGSLFTELRFSPEAFPAAAQIDWSDTARRVFIDPAKGLIALMSPSSEHEGYASGAEILTQSLARTYGFLFIPRRSTRWRRPGDPKNTGAEPDACYYLGDKALAWDEAYDAGEAAREAFEAAHPPDLVIEVERSHGDDAKPGFYRELGVPEMWRIDVGKDRRVEVEILDLQAADGPALLSASTVLPLCTPAFVAEALPPALRGRLSELDALIREAQEAEAAHEAEAARDDTTLGL